MATTALELFIATYDTEQAAGVALKDFQTMKKEGSIKIIDAAVVVHDAEGKVTFQETGDPGAKKWAARGAVAGGVVGLIFPPSIIAGAVVGGAGGGLWGKVRDKGFKDDDLKAIGDSLPPGSSAIIVIAEDLVVEQLVDDLVGYERTARHTLSKDAAAEVMNAVEEPPKT